MRELLIRYLLGELEPHEHDAVHQQLAESPELRRELAHLRSCFANMREDEDPNEPPRGLAERTATWVSESDSYDALPPARAAIHEANDAPAGTLGWSLADLTVAGGVMLAVSMLLFPALRNSLDGTRRDICANNLRELGVLVLTYADNNHGWLPLVQPNENAGIYTLRLVEGGYVSKEILSQFLVCPDSPQARLIRANPEEFRVEIPSQVELDAMSPKELAVARAWMSPTYAYPLGYLVGREYHYVHIRGLRMPILADAPSPEGNGMSANHDGAIIQVLFPDGRVARLTSPKVDNGHGDDMFSNVEGRMAAGRGREDAVLASSAATPNIYFLDSRRPARHWQRHSSFPVESFRPMAEN